MAVVTDEPPVVLPAFLGGWAMLPRDTLPAHGLPAETAYVAISHELALDGTGRRNLGGAGVGTRLEPQAEWLFAETAARTCSDPLEYPVSAEIERRCWRILADLWHAPRPSLASGLATSGATEAGMLAGLALKRRWQQTRWAAGLPTARPNIVRSAAAHERWARFCGFFDVEPRLVPLSEERQVMDCHELGSYVDECTIGVVATLGTPTGGRYDDVAALAGQLDELQQRGGPDIHVHVDAASGGLVTPFLQPGLAWDFRLPRVVSIATAGHEYGMVHPGLGWLVWRTEDVLPDDLVLMVDAPDGPRGSVGFGFTRPASQVVQQYYTFLRHGRAGLVAVHRQSRDLARMIAEQVARHPGLTLWNDGSDLPVVAWRRTHSGWTLDDLCWQMRRNGWFLPAVALPDDLSSMSVQWVVVRHDMTTDMARGLAADLAAAVRRLGG